MLRRCRCEGDDNNARAVHNNDNHNEGGECSDILDHDVTADYDDDRRGGECYYDFSCSVRPNEFVGAAHVNYHSSCNDDNTAHDVVDDDHYYHDNHDDHPRWRVCV